MSDFEIGDEVIHHYCTGDEIETVIIGRNLDTGRFVIKRQENHISGWSFPCPVNVNFDRSLIEDGDEYKYVDEDKLELISEGENFEIGDKVLNKRNGDKTQIVGNVTSRPKGRNLIVIKDRGWGEDHQYPDNEIEWDEDLIDEDDQFSFVNAKKLELISRGEDNMSNFEEGDRVLVKEDAPEHGIISSNNNQLGLEGEIIDTDYDDKYPYGVDLENGEFNCFNEKQIEPASKGEDTMSDVSELEAIAVTGDDDLREKLIEVGQDHGFNDCPLGTTNEIYKHDPVSFNDGKSIKYTGKDLRTDLGTCFDRIDEDKREILELPEDWDRAKAFVTQEVDNTIEPPKIAGRTPEIMDDGKKAQIGCVRVEHEDLEKLFDALGDYNISSGGITIQGNNVSHDELRKLKKSMESYQ